MILHTKIKYEFFTYTETIDLLRKTCGKHEEKKTQKFKLLTQNLNFQNIQKL